MYFVSSTKYMCQQTKFCSTLRGLTAWSGEIYPRNARVFQYPQSNSETYRINQLKNKNYKAVSIDEEKIWGVFSLPLCKGRGKKIRLLTYVFLCSGHILLNIIFDVNFFHLLIAMLFLVLLEIWKCLCQKRRTN